MKAHHHSSLGFPLATTSILFLCVHCGGKTVENEAQTLDPSVGCIHRVGTNPISHACTHTTNGPFVNVVAAESDAEAPTVDSIHVSYLVELSDEMARGIVVFTPSRDGEHLLLLDDEVPLTVSRANASVQPLFNDALPGCETVSYGEVYDFSAGEPYVIAFEPNGHSPTLLFFEHLATFGNGAWQERCPDHE